MSQKRKRDKVMLILINVLEVREVRYKEVFLERKICDHFIRLDISGIVDIDFIFSEVLYIPRQQI